MDIAHKVALITGGAHRVGKTIALAFARSGARVFITYNASAAEAANTVAEINDRAGKLPPSHAISAISPPSIACSINSGVNPIDSTSSSTAPRSWNDNPRWRLRPMIGRV